MEMKVLEVKKKIEEDFKVLNEEELEEFFKKFREDERTVSFLKYYNRSVLDKEKIDFGKFKSKWAIRGMKKKVINFFNNNFDKLKEEIKREKDIRRFFEKYCCKVRKEIVFCSKLFHTVLPEEFPPVDTKIRNKFHLKREIESILIIKKGYELFIKENQNKLLLIRRLLLKPKFIYLRINELSDIRILDMYYWFKLNREKIDRK